MPSHLSLADRIHSQALEISTRYKRAESELIDILQQVEVHRVFLSRGHSSLFTYVVHELGLSENVAYSLITVARKAREVPALKIQLQVGAMSLSNARRVVAILTPANQGEWIPKACTLSSRELEKEIVQTHPKEATWERTSYVSQDRIQLELGLSEAATLRLRRAQDLLSQKKRRPVSLEETVAQLTSEYLERHDPVVKAKRNQVKKGGVTVIASDAVTQPESNAPTPLVTRRVHAPTQSSPFNREPIPAKELHRVNFRDRRRCTQILPNGKRCHQSRWIEIHHRIPVSEGGKNCAENLVTLCSAHHKQIHSKQEVAM